MSSIQFNVFRLTFTFSPTPAKKKKKTKRKGPGAVGPRKKDPSQKKKKRADNETYIDMTLGMKLLQAATESGYPQS